MTGSHDEAPTVRLRRVEDGDLEVFFEHQADPQAVEMAAFPARDKDTFEAHWAKVRGDETLVVRTIVADGIVAGNIGSWPQDGQQLLGYWIGREWWGRGVATQALALLVDEVSVRPLHAHVVRHNAGSIRVLEKCGFRHDRVQEAKRRARRRHRGAHLRAGRVESRKSMRLSPPEQRRSSPCRGGRVHQMDLQDFLDHVNRGLLIEGGSEAHSFMHGAAQEALRTVPEINTGYRTPEELQLLLARLTGRTVDESVAVFPPFYSEFGKNLTLGKNVFINIGCRFQDTGGITIGDGTLIGHGSTLTTLNHGIDPDRRADMIPAPVVLGARCGSAPR